MQNKLLRITFLVCLAVVMSSATLFGQQKTVTGKVLDDSNAALPGASIVAKGTTIGTATDLNGNFTLTVPADATTLVVSFRYGHKGSTDHGRPHDNYNVYVFRRG